MAGKVHGHVAFITGANRGLGKEMALALAAEGAKVALVARNREALEGADKQIKAAGGVAMPISLDVTDEKAVEDAVAKVTKEFGTVDILINNAGINNRKAIHEFTTAEWQDIVGINLTGPFFCSRAVVPGMKENNWGRIINMTSIMSHVSLANRVGYSSTKFGLLGMTKSLALELAPNNITVNGISPGPFATEMNKPLLEDPEKNAMFLSKIPIGAWGEPKDIGSLAAYLCSDEAKFITGTDIVIDGGWLAM